MTQVEMKLGGPWEVRRRFKLAGASAPVQGKKVEHMLTQIPGVLGVSPDLTRNVVQVRYETTKTDYEAIRDALAASGFAPPGDRWAQWRARWWQYLDLTSRDNAGIKPSPCCNKPPTSKR